MKHFLILTIPFCHSRMHALQFLAWKSRAEVIYQNDEAGGKQLLCLWRSWQVSTLKNVAPY